MDLQRLLSSDAPRSTILVRILVGSVFLSEGIQKFLFPAALGVGRFIKIGIPAPEVMAPFVGVVEIVCGTLLIVGLATRLAAIPLIIDMLVAIATTKLPMLASQGWWAMAHEARVDWCMLLGSIYLLIVGAGGRSIDGILSRRSAARVGQAGARLAYLLIVAAVAASSTACTRQAAPARTATYVPKVRTLTVTTVPLLVKEQRALYPFLKPAFAAGGVLAGKEVYAFSPSTFTVVQGDTIHFTLINPEDDVHSFVLPDFAVSLPGGMTTEATYIAARSGIFPIRCAVASHLPMMSGELVVLPASVMVGAEGTHAGTAARGAGS